MSTATRVLVVEDDPHARILLQLIVDRAPGLSCTYLSDPREAVGLLASPGWDVLVTDMQMPGLDGLAPAAAARQTDPLLPVLLMTAHPSTEAAVLPLRGAVTDSLTKPLNATGAQHAAWGRRHHRDLEDTLIPANGPTSDLFKGMVREVQPDVV